MTTLTNRQYYLDSRPEGLPTAANVPFRDVPVADPADGEVVLQNLYISLDPAIRGWMSDEPNYIEPIPVGTKVWATAFSVSIVPWATTASCASRLDADSTFCWWKRTAKRCANACIATRDLPPPESSIST